LDELHLSAEKSTVYHHYSGFAFIVAKSPVNKRGFAGLSRSIDDVGVTDQLEFSIYFGGIGLAQRHHPFFVQLNL
jgi:hypothetical protein